MRNRLLLALAVAGFGCVTAFSGQTTTETRTDMSKLSDAELKQKLTAQEYYVTKENGTEPPFRNAYWNNHADGIYVDVISGVPLFTSKDKFESGTGWPSFTKPITEEVVVRKNDDAFGMERTEVRGAKSDAHLGHVFDDGPEPTGQRYCMNGVSLDFHPGETPPATGGSEPGKSA